MNNQQWPFLALALFGAMACAGDRHDAEAPEPMTPASDDRREVPVPSTTNEPAQPGSPEPMNKPQAGPSENQDVPTPDSKP